MNKVGFSERTNVVIEPKISMQWFFDVKEISQPALKAVLNKEINFFPDNFIKTYKYWMKILKIGVFQDNLVGSSYSCFLLQQ